MASKPNTTQNDTPKSEETPATPEAVEIKIISLEVGSDIHVKLGDMAKGSSFTRSQIGDMALAYWCEHATEDMIVKMLPRLQRNQAIELKKLLKK